MVMLFLSLHNEVVNMVSETIMEHIMGDSSHGAFGKWHSILETDRYDAVMEIAYGIRKAVFSTLKGLS